MQHSVHSSTYSGRPPFPKNAARIAGIGCCLPGDVRTPEDLVALLARKACVLSSLPPDRYASCKDLEAVQAGTIKHDFDHRFFKSSKAYAQHADPQQGMALQVSSCYA